jgi:hypothetical protein
LRARWADVLFWGDPLPREFEGVTRPVRYQVSVAARAFKAQALLALPGAVETDLAVEVFSRIQAGQPRTVSRLDKHLHV